MSWPEVDRRDPASSDTGERRRYNDLREALTRVEHVEERVGDVEDRMVALDGRDGLIAHMAEMAGRVEVLMAACLPGHGGKKITGERAIGWRLGLQFTAAIVIPLALGLLAAYVTLKAAGLNAPHPSPSTTTPGATTP